MALFESGSKRVLKKIRKFAEEGNINKVSSAVRDERAALLEDSEVAMELLELLLEIGHPSLAAAIGEEVMHRHRRVAVEVRNLLRERMSEYSRSTELLRVIWRNYMDLHDFKGAMELMRMADEITVKELFDSVYEKMKNSIRFDGTVHPEADQATLVEWALNLYRKRRVGEAVEFLWKVCREVEYPQRDIPMLAFWIGNQVKDPDSLFLIPLMGIAAATGNMDQAIQFANRLLDSNPTKDEAAEASVVMEKYMVPHDRSKSSALLAEMLAIAGRIDDAAGILEDIYGESLDREELEKAIDNLVASPGGGAAPQLLAARMHLERGRLEKAIQALERAFDAGDAEPSILIDVCNNIIEKTGETSGDIAMKLAHYLCENGGVEDAVFALLPILESDPSWVFRHVQKLLAREKSNASVLTLLAVVLQETGRNEKASAALQILIKKKDKKFCGDAAGVLDKIDDLVAGNPDLLEARALFRLRSEREIEAAEDWFRLLLTGRIPVPEGRKLLSRDDVKVGTVKEIIESGFEPQTPWQAFIMAIVCLRENDTERADAYLARAMEDPDLQADIVHKIEIMPEELRKSLDLEKILSGISSGPAAKTVASILEKCGGSEEWKISLATSLNWDNASEVARFRLKYLLDRNRVILAGVSYEEGTMGEPLLENVALACRKVAKDDYAGAVELLEKPAKRPWAAGMARKVLEFVLPKSPANGTRIRMLMARSYLVDKQAERAASVLDPVLGVEGVMELLEEMVGETPGEYPVVRALTLAAAGREDFDRFHRYSAVLLEMNGRSAGEIVETAERMGSESSSGDAFLYAARVAVRYRISADIDGMLTEAILAKPDIAGQGLIQEFHRMGPIPKALCALALGDKDTFLNTLGASENMEIPLNERILVKGISSWTPEEDADVLMVLAGHAMREGLKEKAENILVMLSERSPEPWSSTAATDYLEAVDKGDADRMRFWKSVRSDSVTAEAMRRLLPGDYTKVPKEELREVVSAVLRSGRGIRWLLRLSDDETLFPMDESESRRNLAEKCLEAFRNMDEGDVLTHDETVKFVDILLSAGMFGKASEVAVSEGSDEVLSLLWEGLARSRRKLAEELRTVPGDHEEAVKAAKDLIPAGRPEAALELLEGLEESHEVLDTMALALWDMGYREQAVMTWLRDYRKTSEAAALKRLFWALGQAGAHFEQAALKRFMASRLPGFAGVMEHEKVPHGSVGLETIAGLRINPGTEGEK